VEQKEIRGAHHIFQLKDEAWTPPTPVPWEVRFAALEKFREQHGHCRVPFYYADDPKLGLWLMNQRQLWKKNKLLPERREALEALGVAMDGHEVRWDLGLEKVLEFQGEHGHTRVPYLHRRRAIRSDAGQGTSGRRRTRERCRRSTASGSMRSGSTGIS
jgi:Helicase associated domain